MNPVFCIRCGAKLDVKTGKCPACDSEKRVQSEESYDKTEYYDEYAEDLLSSEKVNNNNPKNRKKLLIVAAALIFCFVFVFSGVVTYMVIAPEDKNIFSAVFSDDDYDREAAKLQAQKVCLMSRMCPKEQFLSAVAGILLLTILPLQTAVRQCAIAKKETDILPPLHLQKKTISFSAIFAIIMILRVYISE